MPDDVDRIGLAEREIEDDQLGRRFLDVCEHVSGRRELVRLKTERGEDLAHDRPYLRLVVEDVGEPAG